MRWVAVVLCAVAMTGCGVLDDEGPATAQGLDPNVYGPPAAVKRQPPEIPIPQLQSPTEKVAQSLAAGEIGVVGMTGVVGVRPKALDTADDVRIESLKWSRWSAAGALGEGQMHVRECQPTCAGGRTKAIAATVTLSGVRECSGRRYFAAAVVRVSAGEQPATYVRAPC